MTLKFHFVQILRLDFIILMLVNVAGCKKDEVTPPTTVIDVCTLPNGFVKWNDNHGSYCATTAFADEAVTMTINGVSTNGPTLTLDLSEYNSGSHPMTETLNSIFYTNSLGFSFVSTNTNPGTINITYYSTTNHQIKGNFNCKVYDPSGLNAPITLSGSFSLYYTF